MYDITVYGSYLSMQASTKGLITEHVFKLDQSCGPRGPSDRLIVDHFDRMSCILADISSSAAGLPYSEHLLIPPRCCIGSSAVMSKSTLLQQPANVTS